MKEIIWEDYLCRDDLKQGTDEEIEVLEKALKVKLPDNLALIMKNHGGDTPVNVLPLGPNEIRKSINCFYHLFDSDKEYGGYTMWFAKSCLNDDGYDEYLIPFSHQGNIFYCLDYRENKDTPKVVILDRANEPEDDVYVLEDSFDEFLEKYTVEEE